MRNLVSSLALVAFLFGGQFILAEDDVTPSLDCQHIKLIEVTQTPMLLFKAAHNGNKNIRISHSMIGHTVKGSYIYLYVDKAHLPINAQEGISNLLALKKGVEKTKLTQELFKKVFSIKREETGHEISLIDSTNVAFSQSN